MTRVELTKFPGRVGEVWEPKDAHENSYEAAKALGLVAVSERRPYESRVWYMVAWDDRPGVLEVRYLDELTILPEPPPPPEPTDREKLVDEIEHAMWHALHDAEDDKCMGAYVNIENELIDGRDISLRPAVEAALDIVYGHMLEAIKRAWFEVDDES